MEFAEYIKTPKVEKVVYYAPDEPYIGALCLTGHHTILYADDASRKELWILHKNVDMIEKRLGNDSGLLCLYCKDFKQYQFQIPGVENTNNIQTSIETLSSVVDPMFLFPLFYRCNFPIEVDGWNLYSIDHEYASVCSKSDDWRVSSVNEDFSVCRSYPRQLIVPKAITDEVLKKSSAFRQSERFPVLAYCHTNGAALVRCGQPLLGNNNRRCRDDEKLVNACLGSAGRGYILDIRSLQTAQAAKLKGGGYEMEAHYPRWKRIHQSLQRYQVLQESVTKLSEGSRDANSNMDKWLNKLESSNWMHHVKETLGIACLAAQCVDKEKWSVLVHGHKGLDCTLCITSLAQVILDPDCRTISGLIGLIEREWLRAGHPFAIRNSKATGSGVKTKGERPIFSLFLECMYQLVQQFPLSFEFFPSLLLMLRAHSYASHLKQNYYIVSHEFEIQ